MPKYYTVKTFGNDRGISAAFRQWRATHSHCHFLHGYAIGFRFTLVTETLDDKNWCYDYGNFKWVKEFIEEKFDHKTAVAIDDPNFAWFKEAEKQGLLELTILPAVGCERFAQYVYDHVAPRIEEETSGRVKLESVECFEHGSNAAIYKGD